MSFWDNFKKAIAKWFMHSNASQSGVSVVATPSPVPSPPVTDSEGPKPIVIKAEPASTQPKATPRASPPSREPDVVDNALKILGGIVDIAKNSGVIGPMQKRKALPLKASDEEQEETESEESDFVNDSSEVID